MNSGTTTFRSAFWPLFRALAGIVIPIILLRHLLTQTPLDITYWLFLLPGMGIIAALMVLFFPLRVTSEGLHGQTSLGFPCFLSWAEMEKVRPAPLTRKLGIPFVYIHSFQKGRPTLCIPLFLTRSAAFRQAVSDAASPLNPLRQSLENNGVAAERTKLPAG